jgi:hypothetical protein
MSTAADRNARLGGGVELAGRRGSSACLIAVRPPDPDDAPRGIRLAYLPLLEQVWAESAEPEEQRSGPNLTTRARITPGSSLAPALLLLALSEQAAGPRTVYRHHLHF